jgi:hypothetical protein
MAIQPMTGSAGSKCKTYAGSGARAGGNSLPLWGRLDYDVTEALRPRNRFLLWMLHSVDETAVVYR